MNKNRQKSALLLSAFMLFGAMAAYAQSPGGVPVASWWRADAAATVFSDAGVTASTDSSALYQWNDYTGHGYNLVQVTAANRPVYSNAGSMANFNPTITFSSDYMDYTPAAGGKIISRTNGTLYAAGYMNVVGNTGFFGFDASNDFPGLHAYPVSGKYDLLFFTNGGPGYQGLTDSAFQVKTYFTAGAWWQNAAGGTTAYAKAKVSLNGNRVVYSGSEIYNVDTNTAYDDMRVGWDNNWGALNGQLNEMMVFEDTLTSEQMDQVETYLAIKYGSTYAYGQSDYKSSNGTVVWTASNNSSYNQNIAGIARDNNGALYQKQSWSTNPGQQVLISTTGLANTNATNSGTLSNNQYLVWGDNGLSRYPSVAVTNITGTNYRFASVWKVQNTGSTGTVRVAWPQNAGFGAIKLVQSSDPTFATGNTATDMTANTQVVNGVTYNYADVILTDGQYFTFAVKAYAPGGIAVLPAVWYAPENANASKWLDASINGRDLTSVNGTTVNNGDQAHNFNSWTTDYSNTSYYNDTASTNSVFGVWNDGGGTTTASTDYAGGYYYMPLTVFGVARDTLATGGSGLITGIDNELANASEPGFGVYGANQRFYRFGNGAAQSGANAPVNASAVYMWQPPAGSSAATGADTLLMGLNGVYTTSQVNPRSSVAGPYVKIGYSASDWGTFPGDIQEVIWYKDSLSHSDIQKVETYLSLKFGTTLAHNYIDAAGDTVYNITAADSAYRYNIAGIGKEENNGNLDQRQSNSVNTGNQVLVSTVGLSNTNDGNAISLANGQYLICGDNGLAKKPAVAITNVPGTNFRFAAVWKTRNTGAVDTVRVAWPARYTTIKLVQNSDPAFTTGNTVTDMSGNTQIVNGVTYNYADVTLADGQYFTFAIQAQSPGGIATLPAVWYRPDMVSNSKWKDASVNSLDLTTQDASATYSVDVNKGDRVHNFHKWTNGFTNVKYFSNREANSSLFGTWGDNGITTTASADYAGGYYYMPLTVFGVARDTVAANGRGAITGIDNDQGYGAEPGFGVYGGKQSFYRYGNGADARNNAAAIISPVNASAVYSWRPPAGGSTASGNDTLLMGTNGAYSKILINRKSSVAGPHINIGTDNFAHPSGFDGSIQEVIWYKDSLSYADIQKVETYLSLKFGTTLAHNYVNAAGDTVYNVTVADSAYRYNIAGIGKEKNNGDLDQRQSNSVNTGDQVLISTVGLANTNDSNATSLTEAQFLVWGDNGQTKAPAVYTGNTFPNVNVRFKAIWRAQNTNGVGTVRVAWPAGLNNLSLIQSADTIFDAGDVVTDMSSDTQMVNGITYNYADVTLADGQYFTFAAKIAHAPGGVFEGLSLWYRADKNVASTGDSSDVTGWTDYAMGTSVGQMGTNAYPLYQTGSATYLNFNPGINFTDGNQSLGNLLVQGVSDTSYDIFTLTKEGVTYGGANARIFSVLSDKSLSSGNIHYWDGVGINYDARLERYNSTSGLSYLGNPGNVGFSASEPSIMYHTFTGNRVSKGLNGALNGAAANSGPYGVIDGGFTFGSTVFSGNGSDNYSFKGSIGETIVYGSKNLTAGQRNRIDAYLAIKYGITLDTASSYLTSQSAVVWDKAADQDFYHNIAGIGRDDISALYQKQSRSQIINNVDSQITIALDSIYATNLSNPGTIADQQFLIWGDNGNTQVMTNNASTYTTFIFNGSSDNRRMNRIWKVRNTGVTKNMAISFPVASVGTTTLTNEGANTAYVLIYASDSNFSNITAISYLNENNGEYLVTHKFPDGVSYFTYAKVTDSVSPLPVTLLDFNAEKVNHKVQLIWITTSELNSKGFDVQRSTDGADWKRIGFVATKAGNGNSKLRLTYQFTDVHPANGKNFYRLKETDINGSYKYSEVRMVSFNDGSSIQVHPNPVRENIIVSGLAGKSEIVVTNVAGRVVLRAQTNGETAKELHTADLTPGIYIITVTNEDNNKFDFKMVKE